MERLESRFLLSAYGMLSAYAVPPVGPVAVRVPPVQGKIIYVNAGESIDAAIDSAKAGDQVVVRAGIYNETVSVSRSGTGTRPIVLRAETPGTVFIDGTGKPAALVADGGEHIVVSGLTITNTSNNWAGNNNAAVVTGNYWVVQDCVIEKNAGGGLGIFGDGVVVRRVTAQDNGRFGIGGSSNNKLLVQDCIIRRNNRFIGDSNGGGGKFTRMTGAVIQRVQSYENGGPGLWLDIGVADVSITGSEFRDNVTVVNGDSYVAGHGIDVEVSGVTVQDVNGTQTQTGEGSVVLESSRVSGNDYYGVLVYASRNVMLRNSMISNDDIYLKDGGRAPFSLAKVYVLGNRISAGSIDADRAVVQNYKTKSLVLDGNTFESSAMLYRWNLIGYSTIDQVRSVLGFEQTGQVV